MTIGDRMIFKNTPSRLEDIDSKKGIVTSWWSALGNLDRDGDRIKFGSYDTTIREDGPDGRDQIKVLWSHRFFDPPIGRPLELEERATGPGPEGGLLARFKVSQTKMGTDLLILYDDGVITQHSVGIDVLERDDDDLANITKVRLWEGSPVVWGANPLTPTVDVKSLETMGVDILKGQLDDLRLQMKNIRKVLGRESISDETGFMLEGGLSLIETHISTIENAFTTRIKSLEKPSGEDRSPEGVKGIYDWLDGQLGTLLNKMETP